MAKYLAYKRCGKPYEDNPNLEWHKVPVEEWDRYVRDMNRKEKNCCKKNQKYFFEDRRREPSMTSDDVIDRLTKYFAETGRSPRTDDVSQTLVYYAILYFGRWNDAKIKAGLPIFAGRPIREIPQLV